MTRAPIAHLGTRSFITARERFAASSVEIIGGTPKEFGFHIGSEIKRWGEVARAARIRIE
jgi:hypothetical protein